MDTNRLIKASLISIVAVLLLALSYQQFCVLPEYKAESKRQLKAMKYSYDSSQKVIKYLMADLTLDSIKISALDIVSKELVKDYTAKRDELDRLKAHKGARDTAIKKYNAVEVEQAFANRYKDTAKADTIVNISKTVGVLALIDLDHYDTLRKEIPIYETMDSLSRKIIANRDSVITVQANSLKDYNRIVTNYSNQRDILIAQRNESDKALKKSKARTFISQVAAVAASTIAVLAIVKK